MALQPFHVRGGLNADGQRVMKIADPAAPDDAVNLRTLNSKAGVQFAARMSNLPSVQDPVVANRPVDGRLYFVKYDLAGNPIDRLYIFDGNAPHTGGVAALSVESDAAGDAAIITGLAGQQDAGRAMTLGTAGNGAIADLTCQAYGVITAAITTAGTGYAIGDKETVAGGTLAFPGLTGNITFTVTRISGADPLGGYREVNIRDWVKATRAAGDQRFGMTEGDIEWITEGNHEEVKVYDGTNWVSIFSTDKMNAAIAALSLFEGTVKQVGGAAVPGAVEFTALPDLTDATATAAALAKASHYWTFTGTPGYVVQATDPNGLGRDIAGATLQVGDWVQLSNRGTTAAPDLRWVHIGGDLLAKSRADSLYGLRNWAAGNYEAGSLVNYAGGIWRANGAVLPTDTAPGTPASAGPPPVAASPWTQVALTAGVRSVNTDSDLPATAPPSDVYLVLNSALGGNKPALFSYDIGAAQWVQLGGGAGSGIPLALAGGDMMLSVGCPVGTVVAWVANTIPAGWLLCNGQSINATTYPELAALFPGGKVPDFRGAFLRGAGLHGNGIWGDATRAVGSYQEDATSRPNTPFTTDASGSHSHLGGTSGYNNCWNSGSCTGDRYMVARDQQTSTAGAHTHTITGGGDPETRPKNFAINWIIKAVDVGVRYRAVAP